jgi:hypothetical protein
MDWSFTEAKVIPDIGEPMCIPLSVLLIDAIRVIGARLDEETLDIEAGLFLQGA